MLAPIATTFRLGSPTGQCFFAYADEYLVDVKFGSPKGRAGLSALESGKQSSIIGRSAGHKSSEASE
jgi:hypothetical protein